MHVLIATDGSRQSLRAARHFKSFADPSKVEQILVLAVTRPLASVSFVDEISPRRQGATGPDGQLLQGRGRGRRGRHRRGVRRLVGDHAGADPGP
ncbi:hypothetical protein [Janibacter hoylei]|uniref:hypothetical protein n=1 Tax=Janibacter hoylei TaxID=364298 RepID=UPI0002EBB084|nr:hypothetical protein [Janibacter hoylei]